MGQTHYGFFGAGRGRRLLGAGAQMTAQIDAWIFGYESPEPRTTPKTFTRPMGGRKAIAFARRYIGTIGRLDGCDWLVVSVDWDCGCTRPTMTIRIQAREFKTPFDKSPIYKRLDFRPLLRHAKEKKNAATF